MTLKLVLDENVIELAAKVKNDHNELDPTCLTLLIMIYKRCDYIYCSEELLKKYDLHLKALEKTKLNSANSAVKLLILLKSAGKVKPLKNPPSISNEKILPTKDVFLVRLAAATDSTIVSTDKPLSQKIAARNKLEKNKIKITTPDKLVN